MLRPLLFLASLIGCVASVRAQAPPEGAWTAEITPPGASPFVMNLDVVQAGDSLRITSGVGDEQVRMRRVSLAGDRLHFEIPVGHGLVVCNVYRRSDELLAGICVGPMGESVATLRRREP